MEDPACPTVWVMPGDYLENIVVGRDVRIEAVTGADVTIDGTARGSVLRVAGPYAVTLVGLTVTGGEAEAGAGIRNDGGALTLIGSGVVANTARGPRAQGAGVWSVGGSVSLEGSRVAENEAVGTERAA